MAGIADYIPTTVKNAYYTTRHLAENVVLHPIEATSYGLSQTKEALTPNLKNVNERRLPDETVENGDRWINSSIKQHSNGNSNKHACNFAPGQTSNAYGGSFDLTA